MTPPVGITKKEILDYIRLEEDEETAERLTRSSFLYAGKAVRDDVAYHFWSYPTSDDVAWVSLSEEGALGTEVDSDVPLVIKRATAPREDHPVRGRSRPPAPSPDRSPVERITWIPFAQMPLLNSYPVWEEHIPFGFVAKVFSARPKKVNVGYSSWRLCLKLTSGRYASIEAPEKKPDHLIISLELAEDAESRQDEQCIGFVHAADIKEILGALGREYEAPRHRYPYQWRE